MRTVLRRARHARHPPAWTMPEIRRARRSAPGPRGHSPGAATVLRHGRPGAANRNARRLERPRHEPRRVPSMPGTAVERSVPNQRGRCPGCREHALVTRPSEQTVPTPYIGIASSTCVLSNGAFRGQRDGWRQTYGCCGRLSAKGRRYVRQLEDETYAVEGDARGGRDVRLLIMKHKRSFERNPHC